MSFNEKAALETQCSDEQLEFHALGRRLVAGRLDDGRISSDGGGVLRKRTLHLSQVERPALGPKRLRCRHATGNVRVVAADARPRSARHVHAGRSREAHRSAGG